MNRLARRAAWVAVTVLIGSTGCARKETAAPAPVAPIAAPSPPGGVAVTPASAAPQSPPPAWAVQFKNALSQLGGSKDQLVAKLGPPTDTFTFGTNRYDYKSGDGTLFLYFDGKQKLSQVDLKFARSNEPTAGEVWDALASASSRPETFMVNDSLVKAQIEQTGKTDATWMVALNGTVGGQMIQLNCTSRTPLLTGERIFDTERDAYSVKTLKPDPDGYWSDMKVQKILSGKRQQSDMTFWGTDHVLPPEPERGD